MNTNGTTSVEAVVDRISTAELLKRYGLQSRGGLTNRMEALGISSYKEGKQFYVSMEAVKRLDDLQECLQKGGKLSDCAWLTKPVVSKEGYEELVVTGRTSPSSDQIIFSPTIQVLPPALDGFDSYRILSEAADRGWVLPTSKLLPLLQLASLPRGAGQRFERRGFVFKRVRKGREGEWRVERG